jgi:hypothetical protein
MPTQNDVTAAISRTMLRFPFGETGIPVLMLSTMVLL